MKVNSVSDAIPDIGQGAELAKISIKSAYGIIRVCPGDRYLLGMKWQGRVFGLTGATIRPLFSTKDFTALADGLQWILREYGVAHTWCIWHDLMTMYTLLLGLPAQENVPSTTPSIAAFDHRVHISVDDIAIDSSSDPRVLRVHLKQSGMIYLTHVPVAICVRCQPCWLALHSGGGKDKSTLFQFASYRL